MEITYRILYQARVVSDDISTLSVTDAKRIKRAIENKLTRQPETFGRPLRRSLKGYRKLRVGDFRIVFKITSGTVLILAILHRSIIYKEITKRVERK
jgi:mRNA interferase RelE/StbE